MAEEQSNSDAQPAPAAPPVEQAVSPPPPPSTLTSDVIGKSADGPSEKR